MKKRVKNKKGFSAVELIVVIGIFALMTTISIFDYNGYITKIETTDLAQDIALTVRQAQVYGISASSNLIAGERFYDDDVEDNFFDVSSGTVKDITQDRSIRGVSLLFEEKKIIIFEDINRNNFYDSTTDRVIDERTITYNNTGFVSFRMCDANNSCEDKDGRVDITFERPYPDAVIYQMPQPDSTSGAVKYSSIIIKVGTDEMQRNIEINYIGNIAVK
jgi:prepilin-type N-terminal cleavage/methylation domain-containing protein